MRDLLTETIANFASSFRYEDVPAEVVHAVKQRLIDTIGCAIGGRSCEAGRIARLLSGEVGKGPWPGRCLTYREPLTAESAAFVNSIMARYLDFNDTGPGSHPSDCIGGLVSVAEAAHADGRKLITSVVVAYEVLFRLAIGTGFRKRGWDQGFVTAVGTAAGVSNLLGLLPQQAADAISIAAVANVPLRATRAGNLSLWKAAATPFAVKNAVYAGLAAAEGMTGPEKPFEGRFGLWEQITGPFEIEKLPDSGGDFLFSRWSRLKYWPVEYNAQISVWAALELRAKMSIEDVESLEISTYHQAWHEIGSEEAKWDPRTRETADHSLPYIFARALVDGFITVASFDEESFLDPSLRPLMKKISVRADEVLTKQFPESVPIRVVATLRSGDKESVELTNPLGHNRNPMSDVDVTKKFKSLADPLFGSSRSDQVLDDLWAIDQVASLCPTLDQLTLGD